MVTGTDKEETDPIQEEESHEANTTNLVTTCIPSAVHLQSELLSSIEEDHEAILVQKTAFPVVDEAYANIGYMDEKAELLQTWLCLSKDNDEQELLHSVFKQNEGFNTKKKQRKCFKSRRFKFKKKSRTQKVENSNHCSSNINCSHQ
ncbi:unnamed protein product [Microthlaspi erraticum]|uniref:Uncharacterized protein n=1 Tax=Microthlaspi erraticum TaxID=1685480 RepID=A0A6D2JGJ1_9BRAS|nr:unnamed protein product [Microthlaspi erraticum]